MSFKCQIFCFFMHGSRHIEVHRIELRLFSGVERDSTYCFTLQKRFALYMSFCACKDFDATGKETMGMVHSVMTTEPTEATKCNTKGTSSNYVYRRSHLIERKIGQCILKTITDLNIALLIILIVFMHIIEPAGI